MYFSTYCFFSSILVYKNRDKDGNTYSYVRNDVRSYQRCGNNKSNQPFPHKQTQTEDETKQNIFFYRATYYLLQLWCTVLPAFILPSVLWILLSPSFLLSYCQMKIHEFTPMQECPLCLRCLISVTI